MIRYLAIAGLCAAPFLLGACETSHVYADGDSPAVQRDREIEAQEVYYGAGFRGATPNLIPPVPNTVGTIGEGVTTSTGYAR